METVVFITIPVVARNSARNYLETEIDTVVLANMSVKVSAAVLKHTKKGKGYCRIS